MKKEKNQNIYNEYNALFGRILCLVIVHVVAKTKHFQDSTCFQKQSFSTFIENVHCLFFVSPSIYSSKAVVHCYI